MKKYLALARVEWLDALHNWGEIILWILLESFPIFIMSSLWLSNKSGVMGTGYSFSQLITYYVVVVIISRLTSHYFDQGAQDEIRNGTFSRFLLKPISYPLAFIAPSIGGKLFHFTFLFMPVILTITFILRGYIVYPTFLNLMLFIVSLIAAFMLQYAFSVCITAVAFYLEQASAFMHVKWILENVAGGYMIPISIYPAWAQNILIFLPFKYLYFVPAQIFLEKLSTPEIFKQLIIAFSWVMVLVFLSHRFWKTGIKHYSGVGG